MPEILAFPAQEAFLSLVSPLLWVTRFLRKLMLKKIAGSG